MRPEPALVGAVREVDQLDIAGVEEAILQRRVDVLGQRCANARDALPCEHGVRVVQEAAALVDRDTVLDTRHTGTTADEALDAVIVAEIEHTVDHEAQRRRTAACAIKRARSNVHNACAGAGGNNDGRGVAVDARLLVGNFGFEAEAAEVVTNHTIAIETIIMVDRAATRLGPGDVELDVFNDHSTELGADVPRVVAGKCRRGESGRSERQYYGKLPHNNPLSIMSLRTAQTHYRKDGFRAR
ncbi:hypothetical protein SPMU_33710 [Sphingomonas mucosissima]|uniref:Uncharacterized protein n=1 Tax=Sphingomonas mucosissima TaxID=370959 RepID=A0A245ZD57_9SPHN|nr:hypothetical protein SPMU_33710 [Sphingomonas mucosissima]